MKTFPNELKVAREQGRLQQPEVKSIDLKEVYEETTYWPLSHDMAKVLEGKFKILHMMAKPDYSENPDYLILLDGKGGY